MEIRTNKVANWRKPVNAWKCRIIRSGDLKIWNGQSLETAADYADTVIAMTNERTATGCGAWTAEIPADLEPGAYYLPFYDVADGAESEADISAFTYYFKWYNGQITELRLF